MIVPELLGSLRNPPAARAVKPVPASRPSGEHAASKWLHRGFITPTGVRWLLSVPRGENRGIPTCAGRDCARRSSDSTWVRAGAGKSPAAALRIWCVGSSPFCAGRSRFLAVEPRATRIAAVRRNPGLRCDAGYLTRFIPAPAGSLEAAYRVIRLIVPQVRGCSMRELASAGDAGPPRHGSCEPLARTRPDPAVQYRAHRQDDRQGLQAGFEPSPLGRSC